MTDREKILDLFARYARNADARDGEAQAKLFSDDCVTELYSNVAGQDVLTDGPLPGRAVVAAATRNLPRLGPGGWSHHFTMDPLIAIDGDRATIDVQFLVTEATAKLRPAGGWPAGTAGSQGELRLAASGYYRSELVREDGDWKISRHRVVNDLPWIFPSDSDEQGV